MLLRVEGGNYLGSNRLVWLFKEDGFAIQLYSSLINKRLLVDDTLIDTLSIGKSLFV